MEFIAPWPYYRTKYFGDQEALGANAENFEVIIVSPSLLLGPGDLRESSTGDVRKFLEKAVLAAPSGGIAFVDVRDVARGMLLALERGEAGERYLLNAANMTLGAFFSRLSRMSGVAAPLMSLPKNLDLARGIFSIYEKSLRALGGTPPVDALSVEMGQHYWYCSAAKAEAKLGFVARDPGETLRDTIQDLFDRKVVAPIEMRRRPKSEAADLQ
jgi:dihydroflavonol-4-reductase